jgi:hypothetical protein
MNAMRRFVLPLALMMNACVPVTPSDTTTRAAIAESTFPPMKTFGAPRPVRPLKSNNDLALDFIELSFRLESGRDLPVFTRFEEPITVRVTGAPPATLGSDLTKLLHRLRTEARVEISQVAPSTQANVTIEAVSRADIRKVLPHAACFVVPNISSISEYRSARRTAKTNWANLQKREKLAIFLPNDASPQEVRDCLHEELAQAIGPLNDLYRLPDSVFNDDNVHTVLTGFDMMMLRAYYSPELRSGMTRGQVANALPGILNRINPAGNGRPGHFASRTPRAWSQAIQAALGPGSTSPQRIEAASKALNIANGMGWNDHRLAFAHYANGRILLAAEPKIALQHFKAADRYYAASPGTDLHRAYVATQLAAHAVTQGDGSKALHLIGPHIERAARNENAILLSTLLLLRAEALDLTGRTAEARTVRLDSLGWARYGFGPDWAVRAKLREISSLSPLKKGRG